MIPCTCTGCIRQPMGGRRISPTCMRCRRMQYGTRNSSNLPDYYEPANQTKNRQSRPGKNVQVIPATPANHASITPETTGKPVTLTEKDVYNWMTKCNNRETLMRLSRYATRRVSDIDTPSRTLPPIP